MLIKKSPYISSSKKKALSLWVIMLEKCKTKHAPIKISGKPKGAQMAPITYFGVAPKAMMLHQS